MTSVTNHSGAAITSSTNVANVNPIRYRGYYYDTDTSLYYCLSRYYDPEVGRWINVDGILGANNDMLSYNMFAYCSNNPVKHKDPSGQFLLSALVIGVTAIGMALLFTADSPQTVESYQKQQREEAEQKYNQSTVNVYTPSSGKPQEDKVNVLIDKNNKNSAGKSNPNIHIENSYQITNSYEMEAILNVVMASLQYDPNVFYRDINSYQAEWWAHNMLYDLTCWFAPDSLVDRFRHADLDNYDRAIKIWDFFGSVAT